MNPLNLTSVLALTALSGAVFIAQPAQALQPIAPRATMQSPAPHAAPTVHAMTPQLPKANTAVSRAVQPPAALHQQRKFEQVESHGRPAPAVKTNRVVVATPPAQATPRQSPGHPPCNSDDCSKRRPTPGTTPAATPTATAPTAPAANAKTTKGGKVPGANRLEDDLPPKMQDAPGGGPVDAGFGETITVVGQDSGGHDGGFGAGDRGGGTNGGGTNGGGDGGQRGGHPDGGTPDTPPADPKKGEGPPANAPMVAPDIDVTPHGLDNTYHYPDGGMPPEICVTVHKLSGTTTSCFTNPST